MKNDVKVLIVDDDRLIRVAVKRILEKSGHNYLVDVASNSSLLMDILKTHKYNCIILDYVLANTTGIDILKQLNNSKINIPVIMLTGQGDELVVVKALKAGAYDYLPKSILSHADAGEILNFTIQNTINVYNEKITRERTAASLQKSEERYRSLVEHSPMLILRFFPDDKTISFVNDGFCSYFNKDRSEVLGESIDDYFSLDKEEKIDNIITNLNKKIPTVSFNNYSQLNGEIRWQLWIIQALFDKNQRIVEYQCIGEDITQIKEAENEINKQKLYFQSIIDSQENMIIVTDKVEILEINLSVLIFFGYRNLAELKKEHSDIVELALDIPGYITKKGGDHWIDSVLNGLYPQKLIAFQPEGARNVKIFSVNINLLSLEREVYVVTFSDVTELEHKSKSFEEKASIDALTGIFNKNKFYELLTYNVDIAKKYHENLSIIFFDIDHFKKINDTYGHQTGDIVLKELAIIIKHCIRKSDIFARWGGEEFIVLLPQSELDNTLRVAEKMRKKIMTSYFKDVNRVTCSFGVTKFSESDDIDKFIKRADKALYKAKETGRNRVVGIQAGK